MKQILFKINTYRFLFLPFLFLLILIQRVHGSGPEGVIPQRIFSDAFSEIRIDPYFEYYIEDSIALKIEDVSSPEFSSRFRPLEKSYPNFGFIEQTLWIRVRLENLEASKLHPLMLIGFDNSSLNHIGFYQLDDDNTLVRQRITGNLKPVSSRASNDEKFVFIVSVPFKERHTLYFRINTETTASLKASLFSISGYSEHRFRRTLLAGLYIGFILLTSGYFLFLYFQIHERSFIYIFASGMFLILYYLAVTGIGYYHIWQSYPAVNLHAESLTVTGAFIFYVLFSMEFLNVKKFDRKYLNYSNVLVLILVLLILSRPFISLFAYDRILLLLFLISFPFLLYISKKAYSEGFRPARIFAIGHFLLGFFVLYSMFVGQGFISGNAISEAGINIGVILAIGFWAHGVSEKIGLIHKDKVKALFNLQKSEERFSRVLQGANLGTWDWDLINDRLEYNTIWYSMLGFDKEDYPSSEAFWAAQIHPDDRERIQKLFQKHLAGITKIYEVEYRMLNRNGSCLWVLDRGSIVDRDAQGNPTRIAGTHSDITIRKNAEIKRREAEDALVQNEKNLRKLVRRLEMIRAFHDTFVDALHVEVIYSRLYDMVPRMMKNAGVDRLSLLLWDENEGALVSDQYIGVKRGDEELISGPQGLYESISGECYDTGKPVLVSDCSEPNIIPREYIRSLNLKSCIAVPVKLNSRPLGVLRFDNTSGYGTFTEDDIEFFSTLADQLGIVIGNASLFMERQQAETAIRESEERFRRLFEDLGDAVFVTEIEGENNGEILEVNAAAEKQTGYSRSELIGMNIAKDLTIADSWDMNADEILNKLRRGERALFTEKKRRKDESEIWTDVVITSIDYKGRKAGLSINHDITKKHELEEQLQQSQKMEAVGQLAGGIAHDFNNILTIISGFSSLLLMGKSFSEKEREKLEHIQKAAEQAEALTRQLLTFSRKQIVQKRILNVNTVINDSLKILKRLIGENISVVLYLDEQLQNIKADHHQIEQVLMNLLLNARDAVNSREDQTGKKITIQTGMVHFDGTPVRDGLTIEAGHYIMLSVSDNGIGMESTVVKRIFEPFFTTKGIGRGTGLGLSTIYGIIRQNNARITVYSEPGKGTTFNVYWKVADSEEEKAANKPDMELAPGAEHVLLVEDDDGVRDFVNQMLQNLGYHVDIAADGEEALEKIRSGKKPDLLITDLIMPGMNGYELSRKIIEIYPDMKVIYSSGYTDDYVVDSGFLDSEVNFVQKPYSLHTLANKIREVIDSGC